MDCPKNDIEFRIMGIEDTEVIRKWRNESLVALRTERGLTLEQQIDFYKNVVCNRESNNQYWSIWNHRGLIGMAGLENIEWHNRRAEISLLIGKEYHGKGYGKQSIEMLLNLGFNRLNLENIWGECYECNPSYTFWTTQVEKHQGEYTFLHHTKYYNGQYYDSLWFNFNRK